MASIFAQRLSELGPAKPDTEPDAEEEDPIKKRLAEMRGPQMDARGHAYDPRFAPTLGDEIEQYTPQAQTVLKRKFQPQSFEDTMGSIARQKRETARRLTGEGEEEPHGLADIIKGSYGVGPGQQKPAGPPPGTFNKLESTMMGIGQGGSGGFLDEFAAAGGQALSNVPGAKTLFKYAAPGLPEEVAAQVANPNYGYQQRRDDLRAAFARAQADNPKSYFAGEVGSGLATAPLLPGGAGLAGAIKGGAAAGAVIGLGSSEADLTTGSPTAYKQALADTAKSGIAGGLTAGITHKVLSEVLRGATKNSHGWAVNDVLGDMRSAATPTARKQLADDAVNIGKITRSDKELDKAIDAARGNNVDDVQHALNTVRERIHQTGLRLGPHWDQIQKSLPEGYTSGDVLAHIGDRVKKLRATGFTEENAEADALEAIAGRLRNAADWGADKGVFNPKAPSGMKFGGKELPAAEAIAMLEKGKKLAAREAPPKQLAAPSPEPAAPPAQKTAAKAKAKAGEEEIEIGTEGPGAENSTGEGANVLFRMAAQPELKPPAEWIAEARAAGASEADIAHAIQHIQTGSHAAPQPKWASPAEREANARVRVAVPEDRVGQISRRNLKENLEISRGKRRAVSGAETARMRHFGPNAPYKPATQELGAALDEAERIRGEAPPPAPQSNPMGTVADIDAEIARIRDAASTKGFDPNHPVSPEQIQKLWSKEAGIAYKGQGGINGTVAFERKLDVASHLRDLRDEMLEEAAKNNPTAVAALRPDLARYSALKRMEKVLEQRLNTANSLGNTGIPDWVKFLGKHASGHGGLAGAGIALATGHPHVALALAGPLAYRAVKRSLDRNAAALIERAQTSALAREILYLIHHGVPRAAAINAARSAAPGGAHVVDAAIQTAMGDVVNEHGEE